MLLMIRFVLQLECHQKLTLQRIVAFHDPSAQPQHPGWPLRNILHYLSTVHFVTSTKVLCLRAGNASRTGIVSLPAGSNVHEQGRPQAVGWEKNTKGVLASRMADLGPLMDPTKLADQAVDLNLKLMRWRIMPALDLDKIASTKCLLLGAGTLGCYVARGLMVC
jgi:ubiquitin-like modifier-activating enzyme ATG7